MALDKQLSSVEVRCASGAHCPARIFMKIFFNPHLKNVPNGQKHPEIERKSERKKNWHEQTWLPNKKRKKILDKKMVLDPCLKNVPNGQKHPKMERKSERKKFWGVKKTWLQKKKKKEKKIGF